MAKRILPAKNWQRKDDPVRRIATAGHAALKADLKAVFRRMTELVTDSVRPYAARGDWWGVVNHIDWNQFREMMKGVFAQIGAIRTKGSNLGAEQITAHHKRRGRVIRFRKDGTVTKDAGDEFRFDMYDQDLQDELRAAQDELIRELEQGARDTIEQVVMNATRMGLGPDQIIDEIRSTIGLTDRQAQAVMNYRDMLESLDAQALDRQLRNFLEDETVQVALDSGQSLSSAMVDKLTSDYVDNYLDYRAETIARTESSRAANLGLQDAYEQAIDRGVFPSSAVRQYWRIALDEATCAVCRSIPELNPEGVEIGESFESQAGPVDVPPDPHPNCRCSVEIVTDLDQVDLGTAA